MCLKAPCDCRCPYAAAAVTVPCQLCDEGVKAGDFYLTIGGDRFHRKCLERLAESEWMEVVEAAAELCEI
jgi:hypothetical protein